MSVIDNDLLLFDRLEVIKTTINKYGEDNFYLSFSGGKDSTIVHYLLDEALPNNKIPRVYINTGIEYTDIYEFVKELQKNDSRILIINSNKNIKEMLEDKGYPFKSKMYSHFYAIYKNHKEEIQKLIKELENKEITIEDITKLPKGLKSTIKAYFGLRERENYLQVQRMSLTFLNINGS